MFFLPSSKNKKRFNVISIKRSSNLNIPTFEQLKRVKRKTKFRRSKTPALQACPQKKGVCFKVFVLAPKKPNSALRKVVRVKLSTSTFITAHVPGEGHACQEHGIVLIRGGRVKDLPGIRYRLIRGTCDACGVTKGRKNARSKYGVKKEKKK